MKTILILLLAIVLLLGVTSHGISGSFSDTETSVDNRFTAWIEECERGKFNVVNLSVVNEQNNSKIFMYDDDGDLIKILDLAEENSQPSGAASTSDYIYVLDQEDKQVYRYSYCGGPPVVSRALRRNNGSSPGNPSGLAIYGNHIWAILRGPSILYHYSLTAAFSGSGTINSDIEISPHEDNDFPIGLALQVIDGDQRLYVVDEQDNHIYRYLSDSVEVLNELLQPDGSPLHTPSGAMFDGELELIWVADRGTNELYAYPVGSLTPAGGGLPATDYISLVPENDYATGI